MLHTRREFIAATTAAAIAGVAWLPRARVAPLNLLVLGGTGFIGPSLVRYAVSRGHRVTIFTRGRRQPDLPASVIKLEGDRNGKLQALYGGTWDAVIDDSANTADWVRQSTALLKNSVGRYMFTSSTGVYYPYLSRTIDEQTPVHYDAVDPKDPSESFGVAKSQGERYVMDAFGDRGIVVRPTYIVGPNDPSDRFPYWPVRLAQGGDVLAPGLANDPVQFIDVRDLAEFMIRLLESDTRGFFNAVGPRTPMTAHQFYEASKRALKSNANLIYVDDYAFLKAQKIDEAIPWAMLADNDYGMMSVSVTKVVAAGLTYRPLDVTLRDTLAWWLTVADARRTNPRFSIKPDQEVRALAAWRARKGA